MAVNNLWRLGTTAGTFTDETVDAGFTLSREVPLFAEVTRPSTALNSYSTEWPCSTARSRTIELERLSFIPGTENS